MTGVQTCALPIYLIDQIGEGVDPCRIVSPRSAKHINILVAFVDTRINIGFRIETEEPGLNVLCDLVTRKVLREIFLGPIEQLVRIAGQSGESELEVSD